MSDSIVPAYSNVNYQTAGSLTHYGTLGPKGIAVGGAPTTTELLSRQQFGEAGTLSEMRFQISSNTYGVSKAMNVRVAGSASGITASVGAGTTGWFSDTTHTASVAAGDQLSFGIEPPNSAIANWRVEGSCLKFNHATAVVCLSSSGITSLGCGNINNGSASTTQYSAIYGGAVTSANYWNATEGNNKGRVKCAGSFKYLFTGLNSNTCTNNVTLTFRINGADGNQVVTVIASTTGNFADTTHSDAVVSGDDVNVKVVSGAGTVAGIVSTIGATFGGSAGMYDLRWLRSVSLSFGSGATYFPLAATVTSGTESTVQSQSSDGDFTVGDLIVEVIANSGGSGTTAAFRKNTADGNLAVSIAASATGFFEDTTHTDSVAVDDLLNYRLTPSASTTIAVKQMGVTINAEPAGRRRRVFVEY